MTRISVIIVHFKTPMLLDKCIASLLLHEKTIPFEIIVVDNNSGDHSEEIICGKYKNVKWIRSSYNMGFARANNTGIATASSKYVLLLNPDTLFIQPVFEDCIRFFENNPTTGLLGCKLLNADGLVQPSYYVHDNILKLNRQNAIHIFLSRHLCAKKKHRLAEDQNLTAFNEIHAAPWLCGAFLFTRTDIIQNRSLFLDEDFFMYSEDVVWCKLFKKNGYDVIYYPNVSVIHLGGASTVTDRVRINQIVLSSWLAIKKTYGSLYFFNYCHLLCFNIFLDDLLYYKQKLFHNLSTLDIDSKGKRSEQKILLKRYYGKILIKYRRKPSASKTYLKYAN